MDELSQMIILHRQAELDLIVKNQAKQAYEKEKYFFKFLNCETGKEVKHYLSDDDFEKMRHYKAFIEPLLNKNTMQHENTAVDIHAQHIANLADKLHETQGQKLNKEVTNNMPRPLKYGQGSITKRIRKNKNGSIYEWYQVMWFDEFGKRHIKTTSGTKEDARRVLLQFNKRSMRNTVGTRQSIANRKNLFELCKSYFDNHISGKIAGDKNYRSAMNKHLCHLNKSISRYTKDDFVELFNKIESKKSARLCYYLLNGMFKDLIDKKVVKTNIITTIAVPQVKTEKGDWFNIKEQKLIHDNLGFCVIGKEVEFFLMTGCRLSEAFKCVPDFERRTVYVNRSKVDGTSGWVDISPEYCDDLKNNWSVMFKENKDFYAKEFVKLLNSLKIQRQKNEKPIHRLRHTYISNLFYLGFPDKERQYLAGHKNIAMTNDIYTSYDRKIKKSDIIAIYGKRYPEYIKNQ